MEIFEKIYNSASRIQTIAELLEHYFRHETDLTMKKAASMILEDSDEIISLIDNESGADHNNKDEGLLSP